jgi:hypothetical protein
METEIDYAAMSGETNYQSNRLIELNEVLLNGDGDGEEGADGKFVRKGGYFRKRVLVGHAKRDEKPEEIDLGPNVSIAFLKIRRKLVERVDKGEIIRSTNEHNAVENYVSLFDKQTGKSTWGRADELRERFPNLRTVQIVYGLLLTPNAEPELVRLIVKGASLGSEAKAPGVMSFYQYVGSFKKAAGEHFWQYVTELSPVLEKGAKAYFAIKFDRGEALSPELLELVKAKMKEVHENCVEVDEARKAKALAGVEEQAAPASDPAKAADDFEAAFDQALGVDTAATAPEVNPDDIPF